MNPIVPFAVIFLVSVAAGRIRSWPVLLSIVEAAAFAGGMTLVFFGEEIPLDYTPKAILIVLAVVTSVWTFDRMARRGPTYRATDATDHKGLIAER